jgi:localization factor PodJL
MGQTDTEAQARDALLATARLMLAEGGNVSIKALLERSGISRAGFKSCFAGKDQLLKALLQENAQHAPAVEAAAPQPVVVPANDAWLERRLRVFERALQGIEKRQDKFEQEATLRFARMAERLDAIGIAPADLSAPLPVAALVAEPETPSPQTDQTPTVQTQTDEPESPAVRTGLAEPGPLEPVEIAAAEPLIGEKAMAGFLADARRAARDAQLAAPPPREHPLRRLARGLTGWLAFGGVALVFALVCAGTLFASGALSHAQSTAPDNAGIARRHVAANAMARVIALADNGDATAQAMLALAYLRGMGVAGDDAAARRWSMAAAQQGQPVAQYLLGTLELGHDAAAAARWFRAAALQGNLKAMHNLAIAYAQGQGVARDPVQAAQWFTRAAGQGYRDSAFDLAVLYERGLGVPQNAAAALKWYLIAAAQGDAPSAERASVLQGQMTAEDADAANRSAASFVPQPSGASANALPAI